MNELPLLVWLVLATSAPTQSRPQAPTSAAPRQAAPPPGFLPPPLNPTGVVLESRRLADGVYALLSNTPFADNAGFVVGSDAVLVVDSHFNGEMGRQIIAAVRRVTDKPIRYLVNTNAFGDHTFGNYVFPKDTRIVANRRTAEALRDVSAQELGRRMAATVGNDLSVFNGVELRLPDETFEDEWTTDLGGRVVQVRFFGAGMSASDTVVYVPDAKVAWTGNLVFGAGTIPWAQAGAIATYRTTLERLASTWDIRTIVPGHGAVTTGDAVATYRRYFEVLTGIVARATAEAIPADTVVAGASVPDEFTLAPPLAALMTGFHRWNLQRAFAELAPRR